MGQTDKRSVANLGHFVKAGGKVVPMYWWVDGDPLQDIRALTQVWLVIHNGAIIRK